MPILIVSASGVADGVIEGARNTTNSTNALLEDKVVNFCQGGAIAYTSKELIRNLVIDATPNLLF